MEGNYIGTTADGDADWATPRRRVHSGATNNTVGGTAEGARNVISGNGRNGVFIAGPGRGKQGRRQQ